MSNGWKPKDEYKTSRINPTSRGPGHITSEGFTAGFKETVALEKKRVEEATAEHQLKQLLVGKGLKIGQNVLDKRVADNKAWKKSDDAAVYKDITYNIDGNDANILKFSDDHWTKSGYASQTMEFTNEFTEHIQDTGNLKKFFESTEGKSIMTSIYNDPDRFTRIPGMTKSQWKYLTKNVKPDEIGSTLQGWVDDPTSTPKQFLDWSVTPNIDEASWVTGFGGDSEVQELTKGCFGKRAGGGCGGS